MKKLITLSIAVLTFFVVSAQLPVSHVAGKKQVWLDEFTGNTCGYCPAGHQISDQIEAAHPGKVFSVRCHAGSYATPASASNSLDLRVPEAATVISLPNMVGDQTNPCFGFPAASVNRLTPISPATPMCPTGMGMGRNYWDGMATAVLAQNAYVNIAGQGYLNTVTRELTINLEAYYTASSPVASNRINVFLTQDNIIAYQASSSTYPAMVVGSGYKHNKVLRDVINGGANSGVSGELMAGVNTVGTTWTKTFTYTVAAKYPTTAYSGYETKTIPAVLADLDVFAFITETNGSTNSNVIAVCKVPILLNTDITTPTVDVVNFVNVYPCPMANEGAAVFTLAKTSPVTINIVNAIGQVVLSDDLNTLDAGEHVYNIDATLLTDGVYFLNIKVGESTITKRISVLN